MITRGQLFCWCVFLLATTPPSAIAQGTPASAGAAPSQGQAIPDRAKVAAAIGGGFSNWPPYYVVGTPGGMYTIIPPVIVWGQPPSLPMAGPPLYPVPVAIERGPLAPSPPPGLVAQPPPPAQPDERPVRRRDPGKAAQL